MKKVLAWIKIGLLGIVFISCHGKESISNFVPELDTKSQVSISIVGYMDHIEDFTWLINDFQKIYPNVEICYTCLNNYEMDLQNRFVTGRSVDIYMQPVSNQSRKPELNPYISNAYNLLQSNINFSAFNPDILKYVSNENIVYGVPIFSEIYGMVVNKNLFNQCGVSVPADISELYSACTEFSKKGYKTPVLAQQQYYGQSFISRFVESSNNENDLESAFTDAINMARGFLWCKFIHSDSYNLKTEDDAVMQRFFIGDIPMAFVPVSVFASSRFLEAQSNTFSKNPFEYVFVPSPFLKSEKIIYFTNDNSLNFSVFKNSENRDYACEFLRFMTKNENLKKLSEVSRRPLCLNNNLELENKFFDFSKGEAIFCKNQDDFINEKIAINSLQFFKYSEYWCKTCWVEYKKNKKAYLELN